MRRLTGILVALALALAHPVAAAVDPKSRDVGFSSSNVEYLGTVPFDAGMPTGGRLVGKYFYVAGTRALTIYDVSKPEAPALVSMSHLGFVFANEDVDTNGKILIMSGDTHPKALFVWDVTDKQNPKEISRLEGLEDHTFSCVLGCKWAYGAGGNIIDLRDPTKPKVAGNWNPGMPVRFDGFDVTEVAPGIVVTSSRTIRMLDARKNPAKPTLLALGATGDNRLIHTNLWPRKAKDKFLLVQGETPLTRFCNDGSGAFMTWDASKWRKTRTFGLIDEYRVQNGTLVDGNPPAGVWGCTQMWFQEHPTFKDGGLVVSGFFEHGVRFLDVDKRGKINEVGFFTPVGGSTIATYWITEDIVYALDLYRGIDILRFSNS